MLSREGVGEGSVEGDGEGVDRAKEMRGLT